MRTQFANKKTADRKWRLVDVKGQVLGRAASRIATLLCGKDKPAYTPNADAGDFVVVVNAEKLLLTGRKLDKKTYYLYSGYRGGLKRRTARRALAESPALVLRHAVSGMISKGPLGYRRMRKLKIYVGDKHPHAAQKPEAAALPAR